VFYHHFWLVSPNFQNVAIMKLVYQAVGQPVTAKLIIRYQRFFDIVLNFIGKLALAMVFFGISL
jgi:hypothetical protein